MAHAARVQMVSLVSLKKMLPATLPRFKPSINGNILGLVSKTL